MRATIYRNLACSNSRGALAILRERGFDPEIIEYLNTPISKESLRKLIAALKIPLRDLLRTQESAYAKVNLEDGSVTDDDILEAMIAHPILINRPIVVTPLGARLCRPPEKVLEILPK